MYKAISRKLFSILFITVFFCKMVISIAPIIVAHFDPCSVNAAIMQLEIENETKPTDIKEMSVKEYLTVTSFDLQLVHPVHILQVTSGNDDHAKHLQPFYPSVPTPPPNV